MAYVFNSANLWPPNDESIKTASTYAYVDIVQGNLNCDLLGWWSSADNYGMLTPVIFQSTTTTTDLEFLLQDGDVVRAFDPAVTPSGEASYFVSTTKVLHTEFNGYDAIRK